MKKTMIAMAVAGVVAAPMASAEVSISGVVEQSFIDTENDANGWDATTFNMLNFKASEDLGNGMTAFAKYNFLTKTGKSTTETNGDQVVGISGDFGTVVAGTMEDFTEGKLAAMMTLDGAGSSTASSVELGGNAGRHAGGLAYVSPTVNGFHVGIAGYAGTGAANTDSMDAVDMALFYDNGPLSIKVAREVLNPEAADAVANAATEANTTTTENIEDQKTTSIGVAYTIGDFKVSALSVSRDNQRIDTDGDADGVEADSNDFMARVDYTMGNNVITLASANDDSASQDIGVLELNHKFSSRTNAYIGRAANDVSGNDTTYVGLKHKF